MPTIDLGKVVCGGNYIKLPDYKSSVKVAEVSLTQTMIDSGDTTLPYTAEKDGWVKCYIGSSASVTGSLFLRVKINGNNTNEIQGYLVRAANTAYESPLVPVTEGTNIELVFNNVGGTRGLVRIYFFSCVE